MLVLATPHPEGGGADVLSVEVNGKTATRSNDLLGEAARVSVSGWPWEVLEWDGQRYAEQIDPQTAPSNHSPKYFVDEEALKVGVRAMLNLTQRFLTMSAADS